MRTRTLMVVMFAITTVAHALAAQTDVEVETEAARFFRTTMSPFCPGRTLETCPSPQAADLKREIRDRLAAGVPADSIRAELYAVYGDAVRAAPEARGFGLVAWLAPGLALLAGLIAVAWRLKRTGTQPAVPAPALSDADQARLDEELSKL